MKDFLCLVQLGDKIRDRGQPEAGTLPGWRRRDLSILILNVLVERGGLGRQRTLKVCIVHTLAGIAERVDHAVETALELDLE